jgi:ABC-2 type transport system permease protein
MAGLRHEARASYAFVERNFNLVRRYWGWELVWIVYSIVNALSITYIGAGMEKVSGTKLDTHYLILYLAVGTLVWHYLSVLFETISSMISWERWEGTIEYTFMAPVRRFTQMLGTCLFAIVYGLAHTVVILIVVALFFHLDLGRADLLSGLLVLLAGSLSFVGLGIMASVLPLLFTERGSQMTYIIQAVLLLISGVRDSLLKGIGLEQLVRYLLVLLVIGLVSLPTGMAIFNWGERYAKRTGKLKRSG